MLLDIELEEVVLVGHLPLGLALGLRVARGADQAVGRAVAVEIGGVAVAADYGVVAVGGVVSVVGVVGVHDDRDMDVRAPMLCCVRLPYDTL